jgi:uncharacterized membrane protein YfcA
MVYLLGFIIAVAIGLTGVGAGTLTTPLLILAVPVVAGDFGSDIVVAAAQVLHEGMTGGEDPR